MTALLLAQTSVLAAPEDSPRERLSLDAGWRFHMGDDPYAGTNLTYTALRDWVLPTANAFTTNAPLVRPAGEPADNLAFSQAGYDDRQWRLLNLPHDWGIEGPFKQEYDGSTGKLPWWGIAWYRQHLDIPASDTGKKIYLDVDGAMSYATVWLNGQFVGGWPYGYASWRVDLTPYLKFGGENVLAIRLDNPPESSRWYPGGGIYRNVWLVKTAPVHVAHWGTYVTTPEVNDSAATVKFQVAVENNTAAGTEIAVKNEIFELNADGTRGRAVAALTTDGVNVAANQTQTTTGQISFKHPRLWSLKKPQRYVLVTSLTRAGKVVDAYETPFGIRTIQFTADNGFLLNGKRVPLYGVCDHSDLGALGSVVNTRGLERQIEILKGMGCNAIRTSHNPPAPELLDLCDRLGMLVMDESFDCWKHGKTKNDYHLLWDDWHERDWRAELRRDRNHPSIILWSIGNEVKEQNSPEGKVIAAELTGIAIRKIQPARRLRPTATSAPAITDLRRMKVSSVTITSPANTAISAPPIPTSPCSAARRPPASARAVNIFSP